MAAVIGAVEQYIEGEDFEAYTERFGQLLEANNITEDKLNFVCGLHIERIQRKLLQEGDELTWDKACKLALSMEAASKEAKLLAGGNRDAQVNKTLGRMSKEGARPVNRKSRPVPHALYPLVDQELERWIEEEIAEPVEISNSSGWATPLVVVPKVAGKEVRYLGWILTSTELKPIPKKTEAIQQVPPPTDVPTLRSLLGAVGYYSRLLPHLAITLTPLYELLKIGAKWVWTSECEKAVKQVKQMLSSNLVLMRYDPKLPIKLITDTSDVGVGVTLIQVGPGDVERPVAYTSRITKLFSRILNPDREMATLGEARMQRYALQLAAYSYDVELRRSEDMRLADTLSRLPMSGIIDKGAQRVEREAKESNVLFLDEGPSVTPREVATATEEI
ncbi:hypothetical protein O3P69_009196 [Scylla paramamosain]|uniref:RNA-directed DNA polymerase n=1 Tax=Scylla paramamosain TaxID=85552 RepID=A0AAW0T9G6_SCYPA